MFSELNPLGRDTAIIEIAIMLLGAFLIGLFTAWLMWKRKKGEGSEAEKADQSGHKSEKELKAAKAQVRDLEKTQQDLRARKRAAEQRAVELAAEVKALEDKLRAGARGKAVAGGNGAAEKLWEKERKALEDKVQQLQKTVNDNKSEMGRMGEFRRTIKDLKAQVEGLKAEVEQGTKQRTTGGNVENGQTGTEKPGNNPGLAVKAGRGKQQAEKTMPGESGDEKTAGKEASTEALAPGKTEKSPSKGDLIRLQAQLTTQESATRRAEHKVRELEKAREKLTKERDQALEQLDDLQFNMDKLQRQVATMREHTSKIKKSPSARSRQGESGDPSQLTSLKGLGRRSEEFLEKLGITTLERLARTDENTQKHIAKNLDKPLETVEAWVKVAQQRVES